MKHKQWMSLFLAMMLALLSACRAPEKKEQPEDLPARVPAPDLLCAMTLSAESDYPGIGSPDAEALGERAQAVVDFAAENSLNAILYNAAPYGEAAYDSDVLPHTPLVQSDTDPLRLLIQKAAEKNIAVLAVLHPYEAGHSSDTPARGSIAGEIPEAVVSLGEGRFYRPDHPAAHGQAVAAAAELAEKYAVSGIVLGDADDSPVSDYGGYYTYLSALLGDIADTVHALADIPVGLTVLTDRQADTGRSAFLDEACRASADFLISTASGSAEKELASPYARSLSSCLDLARRYDVEFVTTVSAEASAAECEQQLFVNNLLGVYGGVMEDYASLRMDESLLETAVPLLYITGSIVPDYEFEIPTEFRITRPLDGKTLRVDSSWENYYITGTSDPGAAVYCDGEELERLSTNGTFGYLAPLEYGDNTFEFMQNGETLEATIHRPDPDTPAAKISTISTYAASASTSVFQPYGPQAVSENLPMLFQCTAPAGGTVTALLDGETYELEPTSDAEEGTAIVYKKEVRLSPDSPNEIVNIGKVTYVLDFDGETSEVEAPGEVFLIGENRTPMFRVEEGIGSVLNPSMMNGDFMTTLKAGSVGEIVGQTANFFQTSYGGFITKASTSIVTDLTSVENRVSSVEYQPADERGDERLILHGTLSPSFVVDEDGGDRFVVRLIDTYGVPNGTIPADSAFFSTVKAENHDGTVTITCLPGKERYFGYNISYEGTDTVLSFKAEPRLSPSKARPLLGLRIVVDPGHGAEDSGALGVPGVTGPMEKNVNLYAALIIRRYLEGLGAQVYMTRETDDEFLTLDERVAFTEAHDADIFLSVHHNSLVETVDPTRYDGTWVYWYNNLSEEMADVLLRHITEASGRDPMGTESGYYVVLRNTQAPSVLLELGFMPNEREYENICNRDNMMEIAKAVASGVVEYVGSLQS